MRTHNSTACNYQAWIKSSSTETISCNVKLYVLIRNFPFHRWFIQYETQKIWSFKFRKVCFDTPTTVSRKAGWRFSREKDEVRVGAAAGRPPCWRWRPCPLALPRWRTPLSAFSSCVVISFLPGFSLFCLFITLFAYLLPDYVFLFSNCVFVSLWSVYLFIVCLSPPPLFISSYIYNPPVCLPFSQLFFVG